MSDIKYAYPLILNKVASPHYATATLRRPRLIEWLNAASACRAAVIAADAGYGKTTLLWQWEREANFPCYWYKLDRSDRDWTFHISYLIEAISKHHAGFGRRAHSMLQQLGGPGSSRPGVAAYLLAEMHERLTEPCTFIIDDWHYVNAATEVRGLWNQILRDAPATCRFIFASRVKPKLQFARFKTHGGYAELGTDALRFTQDEIGELFRDIYNDPLDASELVELDRRTEGWAASLQLVEVSLREHNTAEDRRSFIESITADSDSDLFDFLAEEVLDQQPEETRNFLLTTSILQQITPEVAERLAGVHDGRRDLAELEHRGLFTNRLDEHRYRYHNLFREFLERRLGDERSEAEVVGLHIHAASYFETSEQWPDAIHHYLRAGLQRQAARLIAKYGEEVASEGRLGLVDEWLQKLPGEAIKQNARLSLLYGETSGMRGQWEAALAALQRARAFFSRKGDHRLEALACLKLSSVYSNYGDAGRAASAAQSGADLVPNDDVATRLRLEGNLAITRTWLSERIDSVARICERIAAEASARGYEHLSFIARHNAGALLLRMGRLNEAVGALEQAASYWSQPPTSPFADNSELVVALLATGEIDRARAVAAEGVRRTHPWPRPSAEAIYGQAAVHIAEGRFNAAAAQLRRAVADEAMLGSLHGVMNARLIEALYLGGAEPAHLASALAILSAREGDSRYAAEIAPARGIADHAQGKCHGRCLSVRGEIDLALSRGANYTAVVGYVKLGTVALAHGARETRWAWEMALRAHEGHLLPSLRWWMRRYSTAAVAALDIPGGVDLLVALLRLDPQGWRRPLLELLPLTNGSPRDALLNELTRQANNETIELMKDIPGRDVSDARRRLQRDRAARLYLRTFGGISLHWGSWYGPEIAIEKRRARMLLGVLAAHAHTTLTRDMAVEILWPSADADSAINNLNQTVFQLRRYIDPTYRGGESPEYVVSTSEHVGLSRELVHTDLEELRRLPERLTIPDWDLRQDVARRALSLVRGEFLADLRYEDWAGRQQTLVHTEVHDALLAMAAGTTAGLAIDLRQRAAAVLLTLDPFDEAATLALADSLTAAGRRVAARELLVSYVSRLRIEFEEEPSPDFLRAKARIDQEVKYNSTIPQT